MTTILDATTIRDDRVAEMRTRIAECAETPTLAIVQVGENEASRAYIVQKRKWAERAGIATRHVHLSEEAATAEVCGEVRALGDEGGVHGIIVQLPLPEHVDKDAVIESITPEKDVDGLTAVNVKKLWTGAADALIPATARGIRRLLEAYDMTVAGKRVLVLGRSDLVGKPTAVHLLHHDATVTIAHSKSRELPQLVKDHEIIIVCVGKPRFVTREYARPEHVIVDVGISRDAGEPSAEDEKARTLVGDVDFAALEGCVAAISPVPGGVGPMTVVSLLENVVQAYERQSGENAG